MGVTFAQSLVSRVTFSQSSSLARLTAGCSFIFVIQKRDRYQSSHFTHAYVSKCQMMIVSLLNTNPNPKYKTVTDTMVHFLFMLFNFFLQRALFQSLRRKIFTGFDVLAL